MPARRLIHYLRTRRKHAGLTQRDLGFLLGGKTDGKIVKHENFHRLPSLHDALMYAAIYGISVHDLFGGLQDAAQDIVQRRAALLLARLREKGLGDGDRRVRTLAALVRSAESEQRGNA